MHAEDRQGVLSQEILVRPLSNHNLDELHEVELRPLVIQIVKEMRQDREAMLDEIRQLRYFI